MTLRTHQEDKISEGDGARALSTNDSLDVVCVPPDKVGMLPITAVLLVTVIGGIYLVYHPGVAKPLPEAIVLGVELLAVPAASVYLCAFIIRLCSRKPALIVSADEVVDQSWGFFSVGHISLGDVVKAEYTDKKYSGAKNNKFCLYVRDSKKYFSSNCLKRKMVDEFAEKNHGTPIVIPAYILEIDAERLAEKVNERIRARSAL